MRRALIIGADGFLGRNLAIRLERLGGWSVEGIGRGAGDLSQPGVADEALGRAAPADVIFHLVTRQRTGQVQYGVQGEMLAINARIHLCVLEAWRLYQPQAKLVSTGSSCTYPESDRPLAEALFGAGAAHPSVTGYALAKQVLAIGSGTYAAQYGLSYLHCVLATLYGPFDHKAADRSHFVGAMLERAAAAKLNGDTAFQVWGDPGAVREVLHVEDQIDAILAAEAAFENRILNCTAGVPTTVGEAAAAVLKALDWPAAIKSDPAGFASVGFKLLDAGDFLTRTGWRPTIALADGLRRLVAAEYPQAL